MTYTETIKTALTTEQLKERIGKEVWVSDIGLHFWSDPQRGAAKTVESIYTLPNGLEILRFGDGTMRQLKFNQKGGSHGFLVFDKKPEPVTEG